MVERRALSSLLSQQAAYQCGSRGTALRTSKRITETGANQGPEYFFWYRTRISSISDENLEAIRCYVQRQRALGSVKSKPQIEQLLKRRAGARSPRATRKEKGTLPLFSDPCFRYYIAHAAIAALAKEGKMTGNDVARAIKQYKVDVEKANPTGV